MHSPAPADPTPLPVPPPPAPALADELAALRAEIARLSLRESALVAALTAGPAAARIRRPGWPIHRVLPAAAVPQH